MTKKTSKKRPSDGKRTTREDPSNVSAFVWSLSDVLRGDFRESEYMSVIVPFLALRRFECAGHFFSPDRPIPMSALAESLDADELKDAMLVRTEEARSSMRELVDELEFRRTIERLHKANLLTEMALRFGQLDLSLAAVSDTHMSAIFEELLRRYALRLGDAAGEFYTPRDAIELMARLLVTWPVAFIESEALTLYDPCFGTGGMFGAGSRVLQEAHEGKSVCVFGQEINPLSHALAVAECALTGRNASGLVCGNTLTDDRFAEQRFAYMMANPPFGVDWSKYADALKRERELLGERGRFHAGLPAKSDGCLLFVQHLVSKMRPPERGGSRIAVVLSASPFFKGDAGSGESAIRCWLIKNDLVEGFVRLPEAMFVNTGIATYVWILSNVKPDALRGSIIVLDAKDKCSGAPRGMGQKRNQLTSEQIGELARLYSDPVERDDCKIVPATRFLHRRITVETPFRSRFDLDTDRASRAMSHVSFADQPLALMLMEPVLNALVGQSWLGWTAFRRDVDTRMRDAGLTLSRAQWQVLRDTCGVEDESAEPLVDMDDESKLVPNPKARDTEQVPYDEDVEAFLEREVLPHRPGAWIDHTKTREGCEINLNALLYKPSPEPSGESLVDLSRELVRLQLESAKAFADLFAMDANIFGMNAAVDAPGIDGYWCVVPGDPLSAKPCAIFASLEEANGYLATMNALGASEEISPCPATVLMYAEWCALYHSAATMDIQQEVGTPLEEGT